MAYCQNFERSRLLSDGLVGRFILFYMLCDTQFHDKRFGIVAEGYGDGKNGNLRRVFRRFLTHAGRPEINKIHRDDDDDSGLGRQFNFPGFRAINRRCSGGSGLETVKGRARGKKKTKKEHVRAFGKSCRHFRSVSLSLSVVPPVSGPKSVNENSAGGYRTTIVGFRARKNKRETGGGATVPP